MNTVSIREESARGKMSPICLASQNPAEASRFLSTPTVASVLVADGTLLTHWLAETASCPWGFLIALGAWGAGGSFTILQSSFLGHHSPGAQILGSSFHF